MINDKRIKFIYDFENAKECFKDINLDGGVCYFLWDNQYEGKTNFIFKSKIENLNNVVFIAAWSGWSDAAESATKSLKEIINQTKAKKFASIDPEDYYLYSEIANSIFP